MKLYKEASLMMLPTSVKDGKLYSIFPQPKVISGELVTNGDFDTDSDWTKQTAWSINNGVANYDGSANGSLLRQFNVLTIGKLYKLNFDILNNSGYYRIGGSFSNNVYTTYSYGNGSNTIYFEATATDVSIGGSMASGGDTFSIDNVSVVEVDQAPADFDFSRGADRATRVTEQGLVRPVEIVGSELVNNGSFDTTLSSELVQNGDFEQIGSELITNGDFSNGGSGWNIADNNKLSVLNNKVYFNADGGFTVFRQPSILTIGKIYKITIDFNDADVTVSEFKIGGGSFANLSSSERTIVNGINVFYAEATSVNFDISEGGAVGAGIFDNISVKEVGQNWTFSGGAEFTEQGARINNTVTGANSNIVQNNTNFTQGKLILFEYDVVATNGRKCIIERIGDDIELDTLTTGTNKKVYFVFDRADKNLLIKRGQSNTDVTLDNISVKEVQGLDDWILGDTAIYEGDGVRISSDGTVGSFLQQRNIVNSSSTYKLTFDVTEVQQSGSIRIGFSGSGVAQQTITQVGEYILYFQPTGTHLEIVRNSSIDVVLDNISVVEVTEATDLPRLDWSGDCPVLLLEPQRTNLVTYSEDFSQWTKSSGGTGAQPSLDFGYVSPDGSINATKVVFDKGSGNTTSDLSVLQTSFSSVSNTASFYVRSDSSSRLMVRNSSTWEIYDIGTEWTRIEKTDSGGSIQIGLREGYGLSNVPNSSTVYLWGAQVEEGAYATSYIPTRGQAATRAVDTTNTTGLDISDFHDGEDFTVFIDLASNESLIRDNSDGGIRVSTQNATASSVRIYRATSNATTNRIVWFDNDSVQLPTPVQILGDAPKVVIRRTYENGEWKVFVNGSVVLTQRNTNYSPMSNVKMWGAGSPQEIKQFTLFDKALSDNECINLTTI